MPFYKSYSVYKDYKNNSSVIREGHKFFLENIKDSKCIQDISSVEGNKSASGCSSENLGQLFIDFFNSEITIDELLTKVDRKIDLMVNE